MNIATLISLLASGASVVVAVISLAVGGYRHRKYDKPLKAAEIEEHKHQAELRDLAALHIDQIRGSRVHTLRIANVGQHDAINLDMDAPESIEFAIGQDMFPFPKLESGRSIEINYISLENKKSHVPIVFRYEDAAGSHEHIFNLLT